MYKLIDQTKSLRGATRQTENVSPEQRWIEIFTDHVRKRFNSRAIVNLRLDRDTHQELAYVYVLEGGGIVLTLPSSGHQDGHSKDDHGLLNGELGTGESEIWISSADQAIFDVQRAKDGELCTGFGYLGLSRTPRLIIPRGTEPLPPRDHHDRGDF